MGIFDFLKTSKINLTYHDNGEIKTSETIRAGKRHGLCKSYHDNGQLRYCMNFSSGVQDDGELITFHRNGKIFRIEIFKNGYRADDSKEYYKNGNIKFIQIGDKYQFYDNENNLKCEINSTGTTFSGLWKEYRKNGSLKYDLDFNNKYSSLRWDQLMKIEKDANGYYQRPKLQDANKILKTNYTSSGDFLSKELINYKDVFYQKIQYESYYAENRLCDKIYTIPFRKGVKGPPGINSDAGKKIQIKPVTSIEDIIILS